MVVLFVCLFVCLLGRVGWVGWDAYLFRSGWLILRVEESREGDLGGMNTRPSSFILTKSAATHHQPPPPKKSTRTHLPLTNQHKKNALSLPKNNSRVLPQLSQHRMRDDVEPLRRARAGLALGIGRRDVCAFLFLGVLFCFGLVWGGFMGCVEGGIGSVYAWCYDANMLDM
jgi:hypothetical protein